MRASGWQQGMACPLLGTHSSAHHPWRASKPRTPFSWAQRLPSAATSDGFLISAPLYIQIAEAQNGNVQVSP